MDNGTGHRNPHHRLASISPTEQFRWYRLSSSPMTMRVVRYIELSCFEYDSSIGLVVEQGPSGW